MKNLWSTKKKACPRDKEVASFEADEDNSLTADTTTNMMFVTIVDLDKVPIT
jgi:hypothetical protein